ncbi:unnamed protein product [Trifolium pratense]|uniref:Uncharacterized protein n=1 Tax=Trifolium pratense TaxID=57577 RepID=A0ACB0KB96_TRIPR|nr:unnamed protein product [Trifolium pratense]
MVPATTTMTTIQTHTSAKKRIVRRIECLENYQVKNLKIGRAQTKRQSKHKLKSVERINDRFEHSEEIKNVAIQTLNLDEIKVKEQVDKLKY